MQHVFVYGSLLFKQLAEALIQRPIENQRAVLKGYQRHAVKGEDYPAIQKNKNSEVEGKLLMNLSNEELDVLSFYEGDEYDMNTVVVNTGLAEIKAFAFTWKVGLDYLETHDWDSAKFEKESLPFFVKEVAPATLEEFSNYRSELF